MRRLCLIVATVGFVLAARPVAQQVRDRPRPTTAAQRAAITGRVTIDADGQRLPVRRARVTLTADSDGKPRTTTTDAEGRYRLEQLAAGTYRLQVEKPGFVRLSADPQLPSVAPAS